MPAIRGITVSVGYADALAITLVRNMRHLTECLVITSPDDTATAAVVRSVPGARLLVTDAFTRHGARFNKGLAMEEGFDVFGREGWLLIWDADVILPDALPLGMLQPHTLYGARRRILDDPGRWCPELPWAACPLSRDGGPIGFFQLFHAADPAVKDRRPWYDPTFAHAGGGDAYFLTHWPPNRRVVLSLDVLHLGPKDVNWFGTDPEGRDLMTAFVVRNGWTRCQPRVDRTAVDRVGEIVERVDVPGYEPTGFELPFVRRAQEARSRS
jgi:hypothetical protein